MAAYHAKHHSCPLPGFLGPSQGLTTPMPHSPGDLRRLSAGIPAYRGESHESQPMTQKSPALAGPGGLDAANPMGDAGLTGKGLG